MELALIIGIFITGFLLVFVEFFFIPGNTIIGLLGILVITLGIYQVYEHYDATTGSIVLGIVLVLFMGGLIYAVKTRMWEGFSHKEKLTGRLTNMEKEGDVVEGDEGEAVSAIRPIGKALIKDKTYEVRSYGDFIDTGSRLKVMKVTPYKIFVEKAERIQSDSDKGKDEIDL